MWDMRPALTSEGHVYLVFGRSQSGDSICRLWNCPLPVVLRPAGEGYHFVGEVYSEAERNWRAQGLNVSANDNAVHHFGQRLEEFEPRTKQRSISWDVPKLRLLG
jgi:hypothetical protein